MAVINVDSIYLNEYMAILKEEAEASVWLEPGVICIYPMFETEIPTQIKFLEIYAYKIAYEAHLQTPHFKHYKTTTLNMVKSLKLIDMESIDEESMSNIFKKMALYLFSILYRQWFGSLSGLNCFENKAFRNSTSIFIQLWTKQKVEFK